MEHIPDRAELGRTWFQLGQFTIEWFDGGGYVESYLMWRLGRVPITIVLAGEA